MKYLMQCGHVANAFDADGKPICAICAPDEKGMTIAREFDGETDGLEGRKARCTWCGRVVDSKWSLPFFAYSAKHKEDSYYCGCGGWD